MSSPFSLAPADTSQSLIAVSMILAVVVLPALFAFVCLVMLVARVPRPPYFAYFCAFGSLGALNLSIATANSPTSALGFFIAFLISPFFLVSNCRSSRPPSGSTIFHRAAVWLSFLSLAVLLALALWMLYDLSHQASPRNASLGALDLPKSVASWQKAPPNGCNDNVTQFACRLTETAYS